SFRPLLRGRGRRGAPSLPSRETHALPVPPGSYFPNTRSVLFPDQWRCTRAVLVCAGSEFLRLLLKNTLFCRMTRARWQQAVLYLLFFFSGSAGLGYQMV